MKKVMLLAGVAALFSANATAAELKPYVGLDYVYSDLDINMNLAGQKIDSYMENKLNSFAVSAGTKFNKNFGVEAFYQQSGDGDKNYPGEKITTNYRAYGLDLIGYLPLGCEEKFELLGSAGVGYYDMHAKYNVLSRDVLKLGDDGLGYRFGAGAQYNLTENLAARVMARYVDLNVDGVDKIVDVTAGVRYSF